MISNPVLNPTMYLINPRGGVEFIPEMYERGVRTVLLTMHEPGVNYDLSKWQNIINDVKRMPADMVAIPWAFLWKTEDCWRLRKAVDECFEIFKDRLSKPAGCWNGERPIDPALPGGPMVDFKEMIRSAEGCNVMFSTTPWAFSGIPYYLIPKHWVIDLQLFPSENQSSHRPRDCRSHFFALGAQCRVHFQHGITNTTKEFLPYPAAVPLSGLPRNSIYNADNLNHKWDDFGWKTLNPLDETAWPYLGPFRGPSLKQPLPSKHPQIMEIKRALHHAGYGDFDRPTPWFTKPVRDALAHLRLDAGLTLKNTDYGPLLHQAIARLAHCYIQADGKPSQYAVQLG